MWVHLGYPLSSVAGWQPVAGVILLSLGLVVALMIPFIVARQVYPGALAVPDERRIRRRYVLGGELLACVAIATGLYELVSNADGGAFLLLIAAASILSSLLVLLSADRLRARSAADARGRHPDEQDE